MLWIAVLVLCPEIRFSLELWCFPTLHTSDSVVFNLIMAGECKSKIWWDGGSSRALRNRPQKRWSGYSSCLTHSPDYLKLKKQCSCCGLAEPSGDLENMPFLQIHASSCLNLRHELRFRICRWSVELQLFQMVAERWLHFPSCLYRVRNLHIQCDQCVIKDLWFC